MMTAEENKAGSCCLDNAAEQRRDEAADAEESSARIQKHGRRDLLTVDVDSEMESITTHRAAFTAPQGPAVPQRGIRVELLERHLAQLISEKEHARLNAPPPKTDFCSTTQRDFSLQGFIPVTPEITKVHDYQTDQAVTFWSENYQKIQGVSVAWTPNVPFRKSTVFSKPIAEQLDEQELPPDN